MTAIILAAGIGQRMGSGAGPKCLLKIGTKSLLQRTLDALRSVGIWEVVLVVGHRSQAVVDEARRHTLDIHLTVLENSRYTEGAILSLWTARDYLDRELIIMDADVFFPPAALERLLGSSHRNCLLVDSASKQTGEEMMVLGKGGRALEITKVPAQALQQGMTCFGESVGFLRLSAEGAKTLGDILVQTVDAGTTQVEHESCYPKLFERVDVGFESMQGLAWIEIDTPEDLQRAREEVFPRWKRRPCINRFISLLFLPWVVRLPLTPNAWTAVSLILGLAGVICMAEGSVRQGWIGGLLFQLFYMVDFWDGEVARMKGMSSWWGSWWDLIVDAIIQVALPLGLAAGLMARGAELWVSTVGWIAALGLAIDFGVTWWAKLRGFGPSVYSDPARQPLEGSGAGWVRWLRVNLTNENFSILVLVILLLDWRLPLLLALAVGAHLFWVIFLLRQHRRLFA